MPVTKTCQVCGVEFKVPLARADTAKTCSQKCRGVLIAQAYRDKKARLICKACGVAFYVPPCHADRRVFCSDKCADPHRHYNHPKGNQHYRWTGGRFRHTDGYLYYRVEGHPFGDGHYVFEHRLVMEDWMREEAPDHPFLVVAGDGLTYLRPGIVVHHINENKRDNRRMNLLACTAAAHRDIHDGRAPMAGEVWPSVQGEAPFAPRYIRRECEVCKTEFRVKRSDAKRGNGKYCCRDCYNRRPRKAFTVSHIDKN